MSCSLRRLARAVGLLSLGAFCLACLALSLSLLWLNADSGRDFVRARIMSAVPGLSVGRVAGTLPWHPDLREVTFSNAAGAPELTIASLEARVSMLPLLRHRLVLDELRVESPQVLLSNARATDARAPAAHAASPRLPALRAVSIRRGELAHGRIVDASGADTLGLEELSLRGAANWDGSQFAVELTGTARSAIDSDTWSAAVSLHGPRTHLEGEANLDLGQAGEIHASGVASWPQDRRLSYTGSISTSRLDPGALSTRVPHVLLSARLRANGEGLPFARDSHIRASATLVSTNDHEFPVQAMKVQLNGDGRRWLVPKAVVASPWGVVHAHAAGVGGDVQGNGRIELRPAAHGPVDRVLVSSWEIVPDRGALLLHARAELHGSVAGQLGVVARLGHGHAQGELTLTRARVNGQAAGDFDLRGALNGGHGSVGGVWTQPRGGRLRAVARFGPKGPIALRVWSAAFDPALLGPSDPTGSKPSLLVSGSGAASLIPRRLADGTLAAVASIDIHDARVLVVADLGGPQRTETRSAPPRRSTQASPDGALRSWPPILVERLSIRRSSVALADRHGGKSLVVLDALDASLQNFATRPEVANEGRTLLRVHATLQHSGSLVGSAFWDPRPLHPRMEGSFNLSHLRLADLDPLLRREARIHTPRGLFDASATFTVTRGRLAGRVESVLSGASVVPKKPKFGDFVRSLFTNRHRPGVPTVTSMHGQADASEIALVPTFLEVLENGMTSGLTAGFSTLPPLSGKERRALRQQARQEASEPWARPPVSSSSREASATR